jgi:hypothetical protein
VDHSYVRGRLELGLVSSHAQALAYSSKYIK